MHCCQQKSLMCIRCLSCDVHLHAQVALICAYYKYIQVVMNMQNGINIYCVYEHINVRVSKISFWWVAHLTCTEAAVCECQLNIVRWSSSPNRYSSWAGHDHWDSYTHTDTHRLKKKNQSIMSSILPVSHIWMSTYVWPSCRLISVTSKGACVDVWLFAH